MHLRLIAIVGLWLALAGGALAELKVADAPDPIGAGICKAGGSCTLGLARISSAPC